MFVITITLVALILLTFVFCQKDFQMPSCYQKWTTYYQPHSFLMNLDPLSLLIKGSWDH